MNSDGTPKYDDPFRQITDMAGVRLICFLKKDVDAICGRILETFDSDSIEDVGDRVFQKGRFGYQSKHILVKLQKSTYLPTCDFIDDLVCEVQVRTILQHAWAEMEHDIQYKGDVVPDYLRKRFAALAGLLEIADGEFERIQRDSDSLKSTVEADLISRLTAEAFEESPSDTKKKGAPPQSIKSVRNLVAAGEFEQALSVYNAKIDQEPTAYTLYIGRAKVRFLLGDSESALEDLNVAESINANDVAIKNLRRLIEDGDSEGLNSSPQSQVEGSQVEEMFDLILQGKGKEAFNLISHMEDLGYNKGSAYLNKAACCLLELDIPGAREYIGKLKDNIGTPMSINIHILKYFICLVEGNGIKESINDLILMVSSAPQFKLSLSPLINFLSGLKFRHRKLFNDAQRDLSSIGQVAFPK